MAACGVGATFFPIDVHFCHGWLHKYAHIKARRSHLCTGAGLVLRSCLGAGACGVFILGALGPSVCLCCDLALSTRCLDAFMHERLCTKCRKDMRRILERLGATHNLRCVLLRLACSPRFLGLMLIGAYAFEDKR